MTLLPSSYRQENNCVFRIFTITRTFMVNTEFLGFCIFITPQEGLSKEGLTLHGTLKKTLIFSAVCRVEFEPNNPNNWHISYIISNIHHACYIGRYWFPFLNQFLIIVFIKVKIIDLKNIFGLRHSAYISNDFQKKTYKFPFSFWGGDKWYSVSPSKKSGGDRLSRLPP